MAIVNNKYTPSLEAQLEMIADLQEVDMMKIYIEKKTLDFHLISLERMQLVFDRIGEKNETNEHKYSIVSGLIKNKRQFIKKEFNHNFNN